MGANPPHELEDAGRVLNELRSEIGLLRQEQARLEAMLQERSSLDTDKLRADIAKAIAEERKIQSELNPTPNNYPRGIKELAKLDAENRKLAFELDPTAHNYQRGIKELAKLDAENRKLASELDPTANKYQRGIKELAKLDAENRKLASELDPTANKYQKGIKELAKLDAENEKLRSDKFSEWFKTIGTFLLAAAAIGTWWATSSKNQQENDTRYRADAAHLVESLGAQQPQLRAAAAIGLRSFAGDQRTHSLVIGSLAYSIGLETTADVQQAMADSLVAAGQDSVAPLQQMITRVNGEVQIGLDRLGDITCGDHDKELEAIAAQQSGMTSAVLALSRLSRLTPPLPPNFSELNFKCFRLHPLGSQLRGAVFHEATLWNADFYGMDLHGTNFSNAHAFGVKFNKAKLQEANFSGADLEKAVFTDAVLDNAQFAGADLIAADFTNAGGVSEKQLKSAAYLYCVKLPSTLANAMAQQVAPPAGKKCP